MIELRHLDGMDFNGRELLAAEALLRRAAGLNIPFVLKGSLLTRQYLECPKERSIEDIDLLYMERLDDPGEAHNIFSYWMKEVTESEEIEDGVQFRSFLENAFWRRIDYAMADDFPTVNTDLAYSFLAENQIQYNQLSLDISFNLDMPIDPIPLLYNPVIGEPFTVPFTVPLSVQVAWKLHQTIVRARYKDMLDLSLLLVHPSYDQAALSQTLITLEQECHRDKLKWPECAKPLLSGDLSDYYDQACKDWEWRRCKYKNNKREFMTFAAMLRACFNRVGLNTDTYRRL